MKNLSAIVWLYRGQRPRFLALGFGKSSQRFLASEKYPSRSIPAEGVAYLCGPFIVRCPDRGADDPAICAPCANLEYVGTQFLTFGAMARLFATRVGFLPQTPRADFLFGWG
jgi:hypothetical protein